MVIWCLIRNHSGRYSVTEKWAEEGLQSWLCLKSYLVFRNIQTPHFDCNKATVVSNLSLHTVMTLFRSPAIRARKHSFIKIKTMNFILSLVISGHLSSSEIDMNVYRGCDFLTLRSPSHSYPIYLPNMTIFLLSLSYWTICFSQIRSFMTSCSQRFKGGSDILYTFNVQWHRIHLPIQK